MRHLQPVIFKAGEFTIEYRVTSGWKGERCIRFLKPNYVLVKVREEDIKSGSGGLITEDPTLCQ